MKANADSIFVEFWKRLEQEFGPEWQSKLRACINACKEEYRELYHDIHDTIAVLKECQDIRERGMWQRKRSHISTKLGHLSIILTTMRKLTLPDKKELSRDIVTHVISDPSMIDDVWMVLSIIIDMSRFSISASLEFDEENVEWHKMHVKSWLDFNSMRNTRDLRGEFEHPILSMGESSNMVRMCSIDQHNQCLTVIGVNGWDDTNRIATVGVVFNGPKSESVKDFIHKYAMGLAPRIIVHNKERQIIAVDAVFFGLCRSMSLAAKHTAFFNKKAIAESKYSCISLPISKIREDKIFKDIEQVLQKEPNMPDVDLDQVSIMNNSPAMAAMTPIITVNDLLDKWRMKIASTMRILQHNSTNGSVDIDMSVIDKRFADVMAVMQGIFRFNPEDTIDTNKNLVGKMKHADNVFNRMHDGALSEIRCRWMAEYDVKWENMFYVHQPAPWHENKELLNPKKDMDIIYYFSQPKEKSNGI